MEDKGLTYATVRLDELGRPSKETATLECLLNDSTDSCDSLKPGMTIGFLWPVDGLVRYGKVMTDVVSVSGALS